MSVIDDPIVKDAAEQALSALLVDRDVAEVASLEGGLLEVVRRGRRERMDAILEGPLFALLREAGAEQELVELKLRGGHRLFAGPLADGRLALRVEKLASTDVTLDLLVEEQLLPPGVGDELIAAVLEGAGVLVLGPARVGRARLATALARAVQSALGLIAVSDGALAVAPLKAGAPIDARARAAAALGADVLFGLELSAEELARLAQSRPALPLVASVQLPSLAALNALLGAAEIPSTAVAGTVAVIGLSPDGAPRLVELHGPLQGGGRAAPPVQGGAQGGAPGSSAGDGPPAPPPPELIPPTLPGGAATVVYAGGHAEPPHSWHSSSPNDDPGWELADAPAAPAEPGSFDAVLKQHQSRPPFSPRPPAEHPQAKALRSAPRKGGDPFGGLTFEPPPGGPDLEPGDEEPDSDDPDGGEGRG